MPCAPATRPMIIMGSCSLCLGCGTSALDQLGDSVAHLRTLFLPERHAIQLDAHAFRAFLRHRVVKTNALDEPAITAIARIRYNYIEKRTILGTATCKSNNNHSQT